MSQPTYWPEHGDRAQPVPSPPFAFSPPPRRSRGTLWITLGVAAIVVVGGAMVGAVLGRQDEQPAAATMPTKSAKTPLRLASEACRDAGELSDADRTLFLDMKGEEFGSGELDVTYIYCVLSHLDAPSYVTTAMDHTRALDGRQSEEWGRFSASWTYHPDDGLDILIRQVN